MVSTKNFCNIGQHTAVNINKTWGDLGGLLSQWLHHTRSSRDNKCASPTWKGCCHHTKDWRVLVAPTKCAGATSVLMFLRFELDVEEMCVWLLQDKLKHTLILIQELVDKGCKKRDLESLLGYLQFAAIVIHPGCMFVCCLIDLTAAFKDSEHWIRPNQFTYSDLTWWLSYVEDWNGISLMQT